MVEGRGLDRWVAKCRGKVYNYFLFRFSARGRCCERKKWKKVEKSGKKKKNKAETGSWVGLTENFIKAKL